MYNMSCYILKSYSYFRCSSNSKDENDYRPSFENFLQDLFLCSNLPEWPAAEVLLTNLGRMFVVTFSNTKNDMTLRSTALDYLAKIATHLRKSNMTSADDKERLVSIVDKVCKTLFERYFAINPKVYRLNFYVF